jgi:hypothetical protein
LDARWTSRAKGRDLIEIEKAMSFDRTSCLWRKLVKEGLVEKGG